MTAKTRRTLRMAAAALLILALFLSALFLISHADHDCTGIDCAICTVLHTCGKLLFSVAPAVAFAAAVLLCEAVSRRFENGFVCAFAAHTPIQLKVKLSN